MRLFCQKRSIIKRYFIKEIELICMAKVKCDYCGDNLTWTLDDEDILTIPGTGAVAAYTLFASANRKNSSKLCFNE